MSNCIKYDKYTQTDNERLKCNLFEIMHVTKMLNNKEVYNKEEENNKEYNKENNKEKKKIILVKKIIVRK